MKKFTVYCTFEGRDEYNYVTRNLTFEQAQQWVRDVVSELYGLAGTTWQNNVAFYENYEDDDMVYHFEGFDDNGKNFYGGYYEEEVA